MSEEPTRISDPGKLTKTTKRLWQSVAQDFDKNPKHKQLGVTAELFETVRSLRRQYWLFDNGKTWVRKSRHLRDYDGESQAFDLVIAKTLKGYIIKFLWGKEEYEAVLYKLLNDIAVKNNLRSLGASYGKDYFHFELPRISQEDDDCYVFMMINALQWHSEKWRRKTHFECIMYAETIQKEMGKKRTVVAALEAAQKLGYIKSYSRIRPKTRNDWKEYRNTPIVAWTKGVYGIGSGAERWKKILEMVRNGQGIPDHAFAFMYVDGQGVNFLNSHDEVPEFCISDLTRIEGAYKFSIPE